VSEVRPGEIIAGKFQIERVIGEGGMGYVVAARHLQLGQTVALKFMRSDVLNDEYKSRFLREARNTVRLKSKHVSRVLDVGSLEGGAPYIVMEYLEGTDLSELLQKRGPFPVHEACDYIIQACEAIAEAHAHGIVHRDLKPANLFLTRGSGGEPVVKVLDFGVSKVLELGLDDTSASRHHDSVVTKATDLLGSPSYMAPEQVVSARDADSRSDVWSLGVILFRLISGKAPFTGNSLGDLIQNIMHGAMPNLRDYRPDIPEGLEHVLFRCMDRERTRRPDVVELARMLAPYAGPNAAPSLERIAILGPALITAAPAPNPSAPSLTGPRSNWAQGTSNTAQAPKKDMSAASFLLWAVIFSVIVCTIAIAGVKYFRSRERSAASSGSPSTASAPSPMPLDPLPPAIAIPATPADTASMGAASSTARPPGTHSRPRSSSTTAKTAPTPPPAPAPEPTTPPEPQPTSEIPPTRD
jgi:serine/threonine protein kinase